MTQNRYTGPLAADQGAAFSTGDMMRVNRLRNESSRGHGALRALVVTVLSLVGLPAYAGFPSHDAAYTIAACGDVDCNGSVTASDALRVLRRAVGLIDGLACPADCPPVLRTETTATVSASTTLSVGTTSTLDTFGSTLATPTVTSTSTTMLALTLVESATCGDFDCGGSITAGDALAVLRAAVGLGVDRLNCDCGGPSTTIAAPTTTAELGGNRYAMPNSQLGNSYFMRKAREEKGYSPLSGDPEAWASGGGEGGGKLGTAYDKAQRQGDFLWKSYNDMFNQGLDPTSRDAYTKLAEGSWFDPEAKRNLYGLGVYDKLARTGGWSPEQRQDWRNRATATSQAGVGETLAKIGQQGNIGGTNLGYTGATRDLMNISSRKALRQSEEKYRQIMEHAPAGIYEVDFVRKKFVAVNDMMCHYTGYSQEEFLSMSPFDMLTEESQRLFGERLKKILSGEPVPEVAEYRIKDKNKKERWVLISARYLCDQGKPRGATVVVHDITEKKKMEEEIQKGKKLESLRVLSAGIAHDFNNFLTAILGNLSLTKLDTDPAAEAHRLLEEAEKAAARAKDLTLQLLTFSSVERGLCKKGCD